MKFMHIHLVVRDLSKSIEFYSQLFEEEPVVRKSDYAKWRVDDMQLNFAVTERAEGHGVDHLGVQVESEEELAVWEDQLRQAGRPMIDSADVHCCYAEVTQAWTADPQGVLWESFHTTGPSELYCDGGDPVEQLRQRTAADAGGTA